LHMFGTVLQLQEVPAWGAATHSRWQPALQLLLIDTVRQELLLDTLQGRGKPAEGHTAADAVGTAAVEHQSSAGPNRSCMNTHYSCSTPIDIVQLRDPALRLCKETCAGCDARAFSRCCPCQSCQNSFVCRKITLISALVRSIDGNRPHGYNKVLAGFCWKARCLARPGGLQLNRNSICTDSEFSHLRTNPRITSLHVKAEVAEPLDGSTCTAVATHQYRALQP
jgi:hypothetical protein